jgi:hypothetical protein
MFLETIKWLENPGLNEAMFSFSVFIVGAWFIGSVIYYIAFFTMYYFDYDVYELENHATYIAIFFGFFIALFLFGLT